MYRQFLFPLMLALPAGLFAAQQATVPVPPPPSAVPAKCAIDSQISPPVRNAIESAASGFVDKLFGSNPTSAFNALSSESQMADKRSQYLEMVNMYKPFNLAHIAIQHTYMTSDVRPGIEQVFCSMPQSGADDWEAFNVIGVPEEAVVLFGGEITNNSLAIPVWLVHEQNEWKIQEFWVSPSSLGEKDAKAIWEMARDQRKLGHSFNAALLYITANQESFRGMFFQLGLSQAIAEDMLNFEFPAEIKGQPPFVWKNESTTWQILNIGLIAIGGKTYVVIVQQVQPWVSDAEVDKWNRDLIAYVKRRFPEYRSAFSGIAIRAMETGTSRGFGTVDDSGPAN